MRPHKIIFLFLSILFASLAASAQTVSQKEKLIGFLDTANALGFGCYFVPPADFEKISTERRYLFLLDDDGKGLINVGGEDLKLKPEKSYEIKPRNGKKRFVWNYGFGNVKAVFNLTQINTANDGSDTYFDAVITVTKASQKQSIQAKGFCGG